MHWEDMGHRKYALVDDDTGEILGEVRGAIGDRTATYKGKQYISDDAAKAAAERDAAARDAKVMDDKVWQREADRLRAENERLRQALRFYARGCHLTLSDPHAWDVVSGEPPNYLCDEAGTATIEDGTIAQMALRGVDLVAEIEEFRMPIEGEPNVGVQPRR